MKIYAFFVSLRSTWEASPFRPIQTVISFTLFTTKTAVIYLTRLEDFQFLNINFFIISYHNFMDLVYAVKIFKQSQETKKGKLGLLSVTEIQSRYLKYFGVDWLLQEYVF